MRRSSRTSSPASAMIYLAPRVRRELLHSCRRRRRAYLSPAAPNPALLLRGRVPQHACECVSSPAPPRSLPVVPSAVRTPLRTSATPVSPPPTTTATTAEIEELGRRNRGGFPRERGEWSLGPCGANASPSPPSRPVPAAPRGEEREGGGKEEEREGERRGEGVV